MAENFEISSTGAFITYRSKMPEKYFVRYLIKLNFNAHLFDRAVKWVVKQRSDLVPEYLCEYYLKAIRYNFVLF